MWNRLSHIVTNRKKLIFTCAAVLSAVCAYLAISIKIETGRSEMAENIPSEVRYRQTAKNFNLTNTIVIVASGPSAQKTASALIDTCKEIKQRLNKEGDLLCRTDHPYFIKRALYYMNDSDLLNIENIVYTSKHDLKRALNLPSADNVLALTASILSNSSYRASGHGDIAAELNKIYSLLDAAHKMLTGDHTDVKKLVSNYLSIPPEKAVEISADGSAAFAFFFPSSDRTDTDYIIPLMSKIRSALKSAKNTHPNVILSVAGEPAIIDEEMRAVQRDNTILSILGFVAVGILFFAAFRGRKTRGAWILVCLATGILWASGLTALTIGRLNLVSSVFVLLLVGLGIDYGIHWLGRFEEAESLDSNNPVLNAYKGAGRAVLTGALTTAAAFAAVGLNPYKGFSELGWIAAGGVITCLAAMLILFPAGVSSSSAASFHSKNNFFTLPRHMVITAGSRPLTVLSLSLILLAAAALFIAKDLRFEHNLLALLPEGSQTAKAVYTLEKHADFRTGGALFTVKNIQTLKDLKKKLNKTPLVLGTSSVLDLLPSETRIQRIKNLQKILNSAPKTSAAPSPCPALTEATAKVLSSLFTVGDISGTTAAAKLKQKSDELCKALTSTPPDQRRNFNKKFANAFMPLAAHIKSMLSAPPPTVNDLPKFFKKRLVSNSGEFLITAYPAGPEWDLLFMKKFTASMRELDPNVTGTPIQFYELTTLILKGFMTASLLAAIAVLLFLFMDFKNFRGVATSFAGLAAGVAIALGAAAALGVPLTLVNVVALPLIIGIGIDASVHITHSLTKGDSISGITAAAKSVFLSTLTTAACFGFLSLASHRGLAGLGKLLLLGLAGAFASSLLIAPAIARVCGLWDGKVSNDENKALL